MRISKGILAVGDNSLIFLSKKRRLCANCTVLGEGCILRSILALSIKCWLSYSPFLYPFRTRRVDYNELAKDIYRIASSVKSVHYELFESILDNRGYEETELWTVLPSLTVSTCDSPTILTLMSSIWLSIFRIYGAVPAAHLCMLEVGTKTEASENNPFSSSSQNAFFCQGNNLKRYKTGERYLFIVEWERENG